MKNNSKRLSLAFIALGLSIPVFASASIFDVTIPDQQGGITFGGDALYMRATAPNFGYGSAFGPYTIADAGTISSNSGALSDVSTSYQWGFDAMLGYRFPYSGNDITLSWTHLGDLDYSNTVQTPVVIPVAIGDVVLDFNGVLDQNGNDDIRYDAVDLDAGQKVNFGDHFNFHFFAGARWVDLKEEVTNTYTTTNISLPSNVVTTSIEDQESEFRGVGPQLGFDGRYCLGYGFGIDANLIGSLLIGDTDADANFSDATVVVSPISTTTTLSSESQLNDDSRDRVVPAIDASLGLDYIYAFNNCDRSYAILEAGYRVINYFDLTQNNFAHDISTDGVSTDFASSYTLGNSSSSIAFDGPYAGIKVNI